MGSEKIHSRINYIILIITPIIISITILVGVNFSFDFDYILYEQDWNALLQGQNPYNYWIIIDGSSHLVMCAYPIGFLAFGGLFYIHLLLPKVFFCLIWIATAVIINNICYKYKISDKSTIMYCLGYF
ncbi:MAG: hypothetical protein ACFFD2_10310, partial [Promethearchaeota archaeon]